MEVQTDDLLEIEQLDTEVSAHGVTEVPTVATASLICTIINAIF